MKKEGEKNGKMVKENLRVGKSEKMVKRSKKWWKKNRGGKNQKWWKKVESGEK